MNLQILNRNIPKKQLNVYPKTVKKLTSVQVVYKCKVTALAGVQQEQSALQNTEKWNTTNSKKFLVLNEF